ncbi:MAG: trimethylamine methyltransferase family protein [Candidatus Nanopelagicales bacterium]
MRWDDRMLDAQFEYSAAGQPVILTPFLLKGAMSPVTIPAALVQQIAESAVGHRPLAAQGPARTFGDLGSFLSNIDMQSGSPQFVVAGVRDSAYLHFAGSPATSVSRSARVAA